MCECSGKEPLKDSKNTLQFLRFKYDSDLQWSRGRKFKPRDPLNNAWTDWVYLDPDRVDLIVQHKLRNMDYYELIQEAGDCIFIPFAMLHQVQKLDDGLQVAASWMFLPETIYEEDVCKEAPLQEDLPLAAMDTLFMYSGQGLIPQGYQDPLNFVNKLLQYMDDSNEEHLSLETFTRTVTEGDAILRRIRNSKKKIKNLYKRIIAYLGREEFIFDFCLIWWVLVLAGFSPQATEIDHLSLFGILCFWEILRDPLWGSS